MIDDSLSTMCDKTTSYDTARKWALLKFDTTCITLSTLKFIVI